MKKMSQTGKMLLRAFTTCHNLEKYKNLIYGSTEEKSLFHFSEAKFVDEDVYLCLGDSIRVKEKVHFPNKEKKLAVIVQINDSEKSIDSQVRVIDEE